MFHDILNMRNFIIQVPALMVSLGWITNVLSLVTRSNSSESLLQGIYWEIKPYIFTNDQGKLDGIIPTIFERAEHFCASDLNASSLIRFTHRFPSRKAFREHLQYPHLVYGKDLKPEEAFWAPVISMYDQDWESRHNIRSFQLLKLRSIAVIVPRHYIDLPTKILRGIASCGAIAVITILLALLFSFVVWAIEHRSNDAFPSSFIRGSLKGFWWSCVSMTTVGYGDTVPRSLLGRFVALWWLFIGVMIGCVMTATVTNIVSSVDDLSIYGKSVAVLENSYESKVAALDYEASIVPVSSYEEVLEQVRQENVFAGLIDADVAAWYQKEIHEYVNYNALHIIKKLPANIYVKCMLHTNVSGEIRRIVNCMYRFRDEIYTYAEEQFQKYCHIETLHVGSIVELCMTDLFIQILLGLVVSCVTFGCIYDVYRYKREMNNSRNRKDEQICKQFLVISPET